MASASTSPEQELEQAIQAMVDFKHLDPSIDLIEGLDQPTLRQSVDQSMLRVLKAASTLQPKFLRCDVLDSWRRPHGRGLWTEPALQEETTSRKRVTVTCNNQHVLQRFQTPHSSYTCDVCRRTQSTNMTMFGCRTCNWDACVPCHGKLLARLRSELESLEAASSKVQDEVGTPVVLSVQTVAAVLHCFEEFRKQTRVCETLLKITQNLAFDQANRTSGLRTRAALVVNEHMDNAGIVSVGFAALHNLVGAGAQELPTEEVHALIVLAQTALAKHDVSDIVSKVLGFLLMLHDSSANARKLVCQDVDLLQTVLTLTIKYHDTKSIFEQGSALIARSWSVMASSGICTDTVVLSTMEAGLKLFAEDDQACEQAYAAVLEMSVEAGGKLSRDVVMNNVTRCAKARFQQV